MRRERTLAIILNIDGGDRFYFAQILARLPLVFRRGFRASGELISVLELEFSHREEKE